MLIKRKGEVRVSKGQEELLLAFNKCRSSESMGKPTPAAPKWGEFAAPLPEAPAISSAASPFTYLLVLEEKHGSSSHQCFLHSVKMPLICRN